VSITLFAILTVAALLLFNIVVGRFMVRDLASYDRHSPRWQEKMFAHIAMMFVFSALALFCAGVGWIICHQAITNTGHVITYVPAAWISGWMLVILALAIVGLVCAVLADHYERLVKRPFRLHTVS